MKLIVGFGNHEASYTHTRHNIGFTVVDAFAAKGELHWAEKARFKANVAEGEMDGQRYILVKPMTFMNASGDAVRALVDFHKLKHHDVLILHDDADMDFGRVRVVQGGNSGGHKGVESLYAQGLEDAWRLKVGVSNEQRLPGQAIDFVLKPFRADETARLADLQTLVGPLIERFITDQLQLATYSY